MNALSTRVIAGATVSASAAPTSVALANASVTVDEMSDLLILILLAKSRLKNSFPIYCGLRKGWQKPVISCRYNYQTERRSQDGTARDRALRVGNFILARTHEG